MVTGPLLLLWLLTIGCIVVVVALAIVVLIGSPDLRTAERLLAWGAIADGGALVSLALIRSKP